MSWQRVWLGCKEAYPLFAVIGGGIGLCTIFSVRTLTKSPEVHLNKVVRETPVRYNHEEGRRFFEHGVRDLKDRSHFMWEPLRYGGKTAKDLE